MHENPVIRKYVTCEFLSRKDGGPPDRIDCDFLVGTMTHPIPYTYILFSGPLIDVLCESKFLYKGELEGEPTGYTLLRHKLT